MPKITDRSSRASRSATGCRQGDERGVDGADQDARGEPGEQRERNGMPPEQQRNEMPAQPTA